MMKFLKDDYRKRNRVRESQVYIMYEYKQIQKKKGNP